MARLRVTADNRLLDLSADPAGAGPDVACLRQGYDGGWTIATGPNVEGLDLPIVDCPTRAALVEAIRASGHEVEVEAAERKGAGH